MEIEATFEGQTVFGTCETMCPRKELVMREREGLLDSFEMAAGQPEKCKRPNADPERVVKKYSRPAAGRLETDPSDLRHGPVLKQTMKFLLHDIAALAKPAWSEIYAFIFDRSRAVRQDMIIQGIMGRDAILILEQAVRFHAYAAYRLRHENIADFDPVINKHHLLECLKRLLYLYQVSKGPHSNRAEFEAVYLLDSLGDESAMTHCLDLSVELRNHPLLQTAFDINKYFCLRNYRKALKLIDGLSSCICLCVVSCHLYNLQVNYLQILSHAYSVKNCCFPVADLALLLHTTSQTEAFDLCSDCGLIDLFDQESTHVIHFNKSKFHRPNKDKPISSVGVLDKLLESSVSDILLGPAAATTIAADPSSQLCESWTGSGFAAEDDRDPTRNCVREEEEGEMPRLESRLSRLELDLEKSHERVTLDSGITLNRQNGCRLDNGESGRSHDSHFPREAKTNSALSNCGGTCPMEGKVLLPNATITKEGSVGCREKMGGVVSDSAVNMGQARCRGRGRGGWKKS